MHLPCSLYQTTTILNQYASECFYILGNLLHFHDGHWNMNLLVFWLVGEYLGNGLKQVEHFMTRAPNSHILRFSRCIVCSAKKNVKPPGWSNSNIKSYLLIKSQLPSDRSPYLWALWVVFFHNGIISQLQEINHKI